MRVPSPRLEHVPSDKLRGIRRYSYWTITQMTSVIPAPTEFRPHRRRGPSVPPGTYKYLCRSRHSTLLSVLTLYYHHCFVLIPLHDRIRHRPRDHPRVSSLSRPMRKLGQHPLPRAELRLPLLATVDPERRRRSIVWLERIRRSELALSTTPHAFALRRWSRRHTHLPCFLTDT